MKEGATLSPFCAKRLLAYGADPTTRGFKGSQGILSRKETLSARDEIPCEPGVV